MRTASCTAPSMRRPAEYDQCCRWNARNDALGRQLCGWHRLTLSRLGFRSPCCFWGLFLRDRPACVAYVKLTTMQHCATYQKCSIALPIRSSPQAQQKVEDITATQYLTVKTRLSISDSAAHKCDGHHKKPKECDGRHKKQVSDRTPGNHRCECRDYERGHNGTLF